MFFKNDMINVNHKIKCTHKGTSILCYIKKHPKHKTTTKQKQKIPKNPLQTANCACLPYLSPGKANEGFPANTHCHDKNNDVQTARSLRAVKSLYTERCHYLIKYARDEIPRVYSTEQ